MAGRPRAMANRVGDLEVAAFELADEVLQLMPEHCVPHKHSDDPPVEPLGREWITVFKAANWLHAMLTDLSWSLRMKAGMREEGPTDHRRLERRPRGTQAYKRLDLVIEPEPSPGTAAAFSGQEEPKGS